MKKEDANTLIGIFAASIGISLLIVGWNESETSGVRIFTLLGLTVLILANIYVASNRKLRTRPWSDLLF